MVYAPGFEKEVMRETESSQTSADALCVTYSSKDTGWPCVLAAPRQMLASSSSLCICGAARGINNCITMGGYPGINGETGTNGNMRSRRLAKWMLALSGWVQRLGESWRAEQKIHDSSVALCSISPDWVEYKKSFSPLGSSCLERVAERLENDLSDFP